MFFLVVVFLFLLMVFFLVVMVVFLLLVMKIGGVGTSRNVVVVTLPNIDIPVENEVIDT